MVVERAWQEGSGEPAYLATDACMHPGHGVAQLPRLAFSACAQLPITFRGRPSIALGQGLRLHDNPALLEACQDAQHLYPVFVIDPYFLKSGKYK